MSDVTLELKGLDQLLKAIKGKLPTIKIGIMGNTSTVKDGKSVSNALIGAVHEFGAPARGIPQRSFLRVPLANNLTKELQKSGLLDEDTLSEVIKTASILPWMEQVAIVAEGVVEDAFETSGDGSWPTWKNPNYKNEGGALLVDTGSLRDSITTEVS